jgi:hypothetical protein
MLSPYQTSPRFKGTGREILQSFGGNLQTDVTV